MDADDMLAGVLCAFEAFVTQFHASLVLTARPVGAVTFDTGGVLREFALLFDMTMDDRHKIPATKGRQSEFQESCGNFRRKESTYESQEAAFWVNSHMFRMVAGKFQQKYG
jgi:hypothetical protein